MHGFIEMQRDATFFLRNGRGAGGMRKAVVLLVLLLPARLIHGSTGPIHLLSSGPNQVTLEAQWSDIVVEPVQGGMVRITSPALCHPMALGNPDLPGVPVQVAIPPGAEFAVRASASGVRAVPGRLVAVEDSTRASGFVAIPDAWYHVSATGWIRHQRVLEIWIFPALCSPTGHGLRLAEQVRVEITFTGGIGGSILPREPSFEAAYRQVINYEQAKSWRAKPPMGVLLEPVPLPRNAVKLYVEGKGICVVEGADLQDAGVDLSEVDVSTLQLTNRGSEVAYLLKGGTGEAFERGDSLLFFAYPNYRPDRGCRLTEWWDHYTRENVYWLSWSDTAGTQFTPVDAQPSGTAQTVDWCLAVGHAEEESLPFLSATGAPKPTEWFWLRWGAGGANASREFTLHIDDPLAEGSSALLRAGLHGYTNIGGAYTQHHTGFFLNGHDVGDTTWGLGNGRVELCYDSDERGVTIPHEWLVDGDNVLKVQFFNDTDAGANSTSFFNFWELQYPRQLNAVSDTLLFTHPTQLGPGRWEFHVGDVEDDDLLLLDLVNFSLLEGWELQGGTLRFEAEVGDSSLFYISASSRFFRPSRIVRDRPADPPFSSGDGQAEYVIIAYDRQSVGDEDPFHNLFGAAAELALARQENVETRLIDVQDIYDEFNYGVLHPVAIRDFLRFAFDAWTSDSLKYVLLFGDASWDYLRHSGPHVEFSFIPCYDYPPSENFYAELTSEDGQEVHPDIHLGRMPVRNADEADNAVAKLLAYPTHYPSSGTEDQGWRKNALLVVGGFTEGEQQAFQIHAEGQVNDFWIPPPFLGDVDRVYRTLEGYQPGYYNRDVVDAINDGSMIVNYIGHGAALTWGVMFDVGDLYNLENGLKMPVGMGLTCNSAAFAEPDTSSLGEVFLRLDSPEHGAVAFWGASAQANEGSANQGAREILHGLCLELERRIGPLSTAGKISGGSEIMELFVLLGDPLTTLAIPMGPDLVVSSDQMTVSPSPVGELQDILVRTTVENLGRADPTSVRTVFSAGVPGAEQPAGDRADTCGMRRSTTYDFSWNSGLGLGLRRLLVEVDSSGDMEELSEVNNAAQMEIEVLLSPPAPSLPFDCQATSSLSPWLAVVNLPTESAERNYIFEIAESDSFSAAAPGYQSSGMIAEGASVTMWAPSPLTQGATYFWRCKAEEGTTYGGAWSPVRSFTVDTTLTRTRWEQRAGEQFLSDSLHNVVPDRQMDRVQLASEINPTDYAHLDQGASVEVSTVNSSVCDPDNLIGANIGGGAGQYGQFLFANNDYEQRALVDLGQTRTIGLLGSEHWIGSDDRPVWELYQIAAWTDDNPVGFLWGALGPFTEPSLDNIPTPMFFELDTPRQVRYIQFDFWRGLPHPWPGGGLWGSRIYELFAYAVDFLEQGEIVSRPVGPAASWGQLSWEREEPGQTRIKITVLAASSQQGAYVPVEGFGHLSSPPVDLASVDQPYMKLKAVLQSDDPTLTPELTQWSVELDGAVDLVFGDSLTLSPALPPPGTIGLLTAMLRNDGAVPADSVFLDLFDEQETQAISVWDTTLLVFYPGEVRQVTAPWTSTMGRHTLSLVAGVGGGAQEVAPEDNSISMQVAILPDPAFIDSLHVLTESPQENRVVLFEALCKNKGSVETDSVSWFLEVNEESVGEQMPPVDTGWIPPMDPGESTLVAPVWDRPMMAGVYIARLWLHGIPEAAQITQENDSLHTRLRILSAADLALAAAGFSNESPPTGDPVWFSLWLRNLGEAPTDSAAVVLSHFPPGADEQLLASWDKKHLDGADSVELKAPFPTSQLPGWHRFFAEADPESLLSEQDEENNALRDSILVQEGVDLYCASETLSVQPLIILVGDTISITGIVRNAGEAPTDSFVVLWDTEDLVPLTEHRHALAGTTETVVQGSLLTTAEPVEAVVRLVIDSADSVAETNEFNNITETLVTVLGEPDLVIRSEEIRFEPSAPVEQESVMVKFAVRNVGGSTSEPFEALLRHRVGTTGAWEELSRFNFLPLAPGGIVEGHVSWIAGGFREIHWFQALANPDSAAREASLVNNQAERSLIVAPRDAASPTVFLRVALPGFSDSSWVPSVVPLVGVFADSGSGVDTSTVRILVDGDVQALGDLFWMEDAEGWTVRGSVGPLEPGFHEIRAVVRDFAGNEGHSDDIGLQVASEPGEIRIIVMQRHERDETVFVLQGQHSEVVTLTVFTVTGRPIAVWTISMEPPVTHLSWNRRDMDGDRVANGVYFCVLSSESGMSCREKFALLR